MTVAQDHLQSIRGQCSPPPSTILRRLQHGARHALTRRRLLWIGTAAIGAYLSDPVREALAQNATAARSAMDQVVPKDGVTLKAFFGDAIQRLIAAGALDPDKFEAQYRPTGGLPAWTAKLLRTPSREPILLSNETAPYLLNLLWPLGLAAKMRINRQSPLNTLRLPSFASTGGWSLGKMQSGYVYFNAVDALALSGKQEALVHGAATKTFRPCCDNSTFYQDCNHGSALLGLMELAASQGATLDEIYRGALAANSYWFPDKYVLTALYFMRAGHPRWNSVEPAVVLGHEFSSLSGWQRNVNAPLLSAHVRLPSDLASQLACGI